MCPKPDTDARYLAPSSRVRPVPAAWLASFGLAIGLLVSTASPFTLAAEIDSLSGLDKLEEKLFMHRYEREPEESRLGRLEEFVFGVRKNGSAEQRKASLLAAMKVPQPVGVGIAATQPSLQMEQAEIATGSTGDSEAASDASAVDDGSGAAAAMQAQARDRAGSGIEQRSKRNWMARSGDGASEQRRTGTTGSAKHREFEPADSSPASRSGTEFVNEAPALGSNGALMPQVAPDFRRKSARVALAPPYAVRSGEAGRGRSDGFAAAGSPTNSGGQILERVGALELQAFGMTFQSNSLPERLARLEWNQFPGAAARTDLPITARVDRLASDRAVKARYQSGRGNASY